MFFYSVFTNFDMFVWFERSISRLVVFTLVHVECLFTLFYIDTPHCYTTCTSWALAKISVKRVKPIKEKKATHMEIYL